MGSRWLQNVIVSLSLLFQVNVISKRSLSEFHYRMMLLRVQFIVAKCPLKGYQGIKKWPDGCNWAYCRLSSLGWIGRWESRTWNKKNKWQGYFQPIPFHLSGWRAGGGIRSEPRDRQWHGKRKLMTVLNKTFDRQVYSVPEGVILLVAFWCFWTITLTWLFTARIFLSHSFRLRSHCMKRFV